MMDAAPPTTARLLYTTGARRGLYIRFFLRALLGMVLAILLGVAVTNLMQREPQTSVLLQLALLLAILFGLWFAIRLVVQLVRIFTRRSATVRLYDKGIVWSEKGRTTKHRWTEIVRFREGARALRLFGRPLLEWGAHILTMEDGSEYRFSPYLGDVEAFAQYVRPYASHVTSLRMGKALRREQPVKLSDKLVIYPGGVAYKRAEVPWAELRVTVDPGFEQITLRRLQAGVKPKTLARMPVYSLDNAGGFVEIARPQIESFSQRLD
ncbi:MAG: hypothetical protein U0452_03210 [Anaerolineae bacterium]